MSLLVWILMKLTRRKKEAVPSWCFLAANLVVAVLFALGHLPATKVLFGTITPVIFVRCMLLNGGLGFVFGLLYRKWGIQYAMVAHALVHVVCDALLFIVVK
jgi:membrane protease YdiL (CAAX protease family)